MREEAFPLALDLLPLGLPPAWIFFAGAVLVALLGRPGLRSAQTAVMLVTPVVGALNLLSLPVGDTWVLSVLDLELVQLRVDRLSILFGLLFHIGAFLGGIYALRARDTLQHAAALVYGGSALGAVFAGDLLTLFCYWEGMAVSSALLVFAGRTPESTAAAFRYLALHLLSGLLLLAGALLVYRETGSIEFDWIGTGSTAGWLILAGFGIKAGFPLVHTWITDGYPRSTPSGTVFLSMFTTKVAVYALARGFAGTCRVDDLAGPPDQPIVPQESAIQLEELTHAPRAKALLEDP